MYKFSTLAGLMLLFSGCLSDFRELDVPPADPALVIYGFLDTDSLIQVYISALMPATGEAELPLIEGATVQVTDLGTGRSEVLPMVSPGKYRVLNWQPEPGHTYQLQVQAADFPLVQATTTIPELVEIEHVEVDTSEIIDHRFQGTMILTDPAQEANYYAIVGLYKRYSTFSGDTVTEVVGLSPEILGEYAIWNRLAQAMILPDKGFDGKTNYPLLINVSRSGTNQYTKVSAKLRHCSYDYYQFMLTYQEQEYLIYDEFAEPWPVHSNIEGGYGIFAGYATSSRRIAIAE